MGNSDINLKKGLDKMEEIGLMSKGGRKEWSKKRRGCSDGNSMRYCLDCPNSYGTRKCKGFRKKYKLKIGYFSSYEEMVNGVIRKHMKKS